jgi:IclR family transcriptional regulator, acetate operon repressor
MTGRQPTLIGSVQRALNLVDAVGASDRPVPAKALARLTGQNLSTTYHLLRTLVFERYLRRDGGGYVLGDRITALGRPTTSGILVAKVRPLLRALHDELHAAAYLSIYHGGEIQFVDVADSPDNPRVDLWVGLHDAAHACALGKAVLGGLSGVDREDYLARHDLADLTRHTITDRENLRRDLAANPVLALDREEYAVGTVCVAAAVVAPDVVGAVAVSVPVRRLAQVVTRGDALTHTARLAAMALAN